jgi:hypothetical protein
VTTLDLSVLDAPSTSPEPLLAAGFVAPGVRAAAGPSREAGTPGVGSAVGGVTQPGGAAAVPAAVPAAGRVDVTASLALAEGRLAFSANVVPVRIAESGASQPAAVSREGAAAPAPTLTENRYLPGGGGEPDGSYDEADDVWLGADNAATANFVPATSGPAGTRAETAAVARQGGETARDNAAGGLPAGRPDVRVLDAYFAGPAGADALPASAPVLSCPAAAPEESPASPDRAGRPGPVVALAGFFAGVLGRVGAGSWGRRNRRDGDPNGRDTR